jgi:hypothetical protein
MEMVGLAGGCIVGGVTVSPVRVGDGQCGVWGAWGGGGAGVAPSYGGLRGSQGQGQK